VAERSQTRAAVVSAFETPRGQAPKEQKPSSIDYLASLTRVERASLVLQENGEVPRLGPLPVVAAILRHLPDFEDQAIIHEAAEIMNRAGVQPSDLFSALAFSERIAELTKDVNMTAAALLYHSLGPAGSSSPGYLSKSVIEEYLGKTVADLTESCAQMMALHSDSREMLWSDNTVMRMSPEQAAIQQNMIVAMASDWRVVTLVLVHHGRHLKDLMARAAENPSARGRGRSAYIMAAEALDVYAPLAHRLGMRGIKNELEDLAFRHLYPADHSVVSNELEKRSADHEVVIQEVMIKLKRMLLEDPIFLNGIVHVDFESRRKAPYSVWRKMVKFQAKAEEAGEPMLLASEAIDQVLDHLAFRIVFEVLPGVDQEQEEALRARGEALCYHVLDLVHSQWDHNALRLKDYIAEPKTNGYQSLHTTAAARLHGRLWPFEVQVRTKEMHRVAEWGQAAHASYKMNQLDEDRWSFLADPVVSGPAISDATPLPLLSRRSDEEAKELVERTPPQNEREYAGCLRDHLLSRRVFVFMKNVGRTSIWDLERGLSIKDAIWRHRDIIGVEEALSRLRVNGYAVSSDYKLRNGDAITL